MKSIAVRRPSLSRTMNLSFVSPSNTLGFPISRPHTTGFKAAKSRSVSVLKAQEDYEMYQSASRQLETLTKSLKNLKKKKDDLMTSNEGLQQQIAYYIQESQNIKRNQEKLHNESLRISKQTLKLEMERFSLKKPILTIEKEIRSLDQDIINGENSRKIMQEKQESVNKEVNKLKNEIKLSKAKLKEEELQKSRIYGQNDMILEEIEAIRRELEILRS